MKADELNACRLFFVNDIIKIVFLNKEIDMSTIEIKKNIVDKLESVQDAIVLGEIYRILTLDLNTDNKYVFSEPQLSVLNERDVAIDKGHYFTDEEANKDLEEWLKK